MEYMPDIPNSFCHKNYRTRQNSEVAIYSDRIEIYNPGTFPENINPEDFIKGTGESIHRNPLLARIMYYSKEIEDFGTGLKRIAEACRNAGIRYEFVRSNLGFKVVFYRPPLWTSDNMEENLRNGSNQVSREVEGQITLPVTSTVQDTSQDISRDTSRDTSRENRNALILEFCVVPRTRGEIQRNVNITNRSYFSRVFLKPLLDSGKLQMTVPDKPNSRNQKYLRGRK
jgi:ATP-dependent DNA helicase RecG